MFQGSLMTNNEVMISYLPLAHMYERICEVMLNVFSELLVYPDGLELGIFRSLKQLRNYA